MTADTILAMLQCVRDGELRPEEAMERLAKLPYEEAGFAKIDHHRRLRTGLPEVIYAGGKTSAQVGEIFFRMAAVGGDVLATRADEAAFAAVKALVPEAQYHPVARIVGLRQTPPGEPGNESTGSIAVALGLLDAGGARLETDTRRSRRDRPTGARLGATTAQQRAVVD
jgi:NCAIR mutase (PurE)-related protein